MAPRGTSMPTHHQLDSCRTPFRIGQDYCWNDEPRALAYLQKITGFYSPVGAANMVDGYDLNGTPHPNTGRPAGRRSSARPASARWPPAHLLELRDDAYAGVATLTPAAGSPYYKESWTVLSLMMMNGRLRGSDRELTAVMSDQAGTST